VPRDDEQDKRKRKRAEDAKNLKRPGYWSCWNCTAHNKKENKRCDICGAKRNGPAGTN
jgi:rubrerythrin